MKEKKIEKEEEKDPYKKEYSTFKNTVYVMSNAFREEKGLLPFFIIAAIAGASMSFIWTFFSKAVIAQVENNAELSVLIITVIIAVSVQLIFTMSNSYAESKLWWKYIRARMWFLQICNRKTLTMDFEKLESPKMLDMREKGMNSCNGNMDGVEGTMHTMQDMAKQLIMMIASGAVIIRLNLWFVAVVAVLSIINYLVIDHGKKIDKLKVWDPMAPYWRKINYMNWAVSDFGSAKDIRLYGMKDWFIHKHREVNKVAHAKIALSKKIWIITAIISRVVIDLMEIALYIWLIYEVLENNMLISDFVLLLGMVRTFSSGVNGFLDRGTELKKKSREVNDFRTFLEYPDAETGHKPIPELSEYNFKFENVSFKYRGSESYALKDMSIDFKSGERLAVVGLNGAGKSTFIKLLMRLYSPSEGRILLNGTDISEYDRAEYFKLFSPLFQDVQLFAFPLAENVSMLAPDDTDVMKAERCLRLAGLGEKLESLPDGSKTEILKVLYDDGIDLSGGEKQKLALARALYKNSPVIILDEPTSALDALAEYELYKNFDELISDKSAIYISHRLSSTRFCDRVAMFKDGSLSEIGTHDELLNLGGAYSELFNVQAQYYKEEESVYA